MRHSVITVIATLLVLTGCGGRPLSKGTWVSGDGQMVLTVSGSTLDLEVPDPHARNRRIRAEGVKFTSKQYGADAHRITFNRKDLVFRELVVYPDRGLLNAYTHQNQRIPMTLKP